MPVSESGTAITLPSNDFVAPAMRGRAITAPNPDIAASRKRSLHTVRNLVARLFVIFGVTSREQLAVECVRRGLYAPT